MQRLLPVLFLLAAGTQAEPLNYNVVSLDAEVHREIPNDQMRASLFAEHSDIDPAKLANLINRQMNDARKLAALYPSIRFASGDNQTYPVYDNKNRLAGWRSRAEVRLECRDLRMCSELIGKLQGGLQLGNWEFAIADDTRQRIEAELTIAAIAAFRAKADVIAQAFAGRPYRIVNMTLNSRLPYAPQVAFGKAAMMAADAAPPLAEGGSGSVVVTVSGSIQVQVQE